MNKRVTKKKTKIQKDAQNWRDFMDWLFVENLNNPVTKDELFLFVADKVLEKGD